MPFDFKKEYKEYYMPKNKPQIVEIPTMNYIAVRGKGDPNDENGEYKRAIEVLYAVAYTLKMAVRTTSAVTACTMRYTSQIRGKRFLKSGRLLSDTR